MSSHLATHSSDPAGRRGRHDEIILHVGSAGSTAQRLTRRASLMLVLALSLALWAAIWGVSVWLVSVLEG
jgi:hypothetical protein